jgi:hypothetical protein
MLLLLFSTLFTYAENYASEFMIADQRLFFLLQQQWLDLSCLVNTSLSSITVPASTLITFSSTLAGLLR